MKSKFQCPNCGENLTEISVELYRLEKQGNEIEKVVDKLIKTIFDDEELGAISDRRSNV